MCVFFSKEAYTKRLNYRSIRRTNGGSVIKKYLRFSEIEHIVFYSPFPRCKLSAPLPALSSQRYQSKGLFLETPSVSWRDGRFTVELPETLRASAGDSSAVVAGETEMILESRDAAFDLEARESVGKLAALYRTHVRCGTTVGFRSSLPSIVVRLWGTTIAMHEQTSVCWGEVSPLLIRVVERVDLACASVAAASTVFATHNTSCFFISAGMVRSPLRDFSLALQGSLHDVRAGSDLPQA